MTRRLLTALCLGAALPTAVGAQSRPQPITIVGGASAGEHVERQWVAVLRPRPVASSPAGLTLSIPADPAGTGSLPVDYERPIEFRWSFGDHPGTISTGERPAVTHAYSESGDYTLRVEAWSDGQLFAEGEKDVTVRNRSPWELQIGAIQIDPDGTTFELTALANDVDKDELLYAWDFDGGEPDVITDQWRIEHEFERSGRFDVKLLVSDDEGGSRGVERTITVAGADDVQGFQPLDTRPTDAARTAIRLSVSGDVDFEFKGRIRPVAGIHLSSLGAGRGCRFMFSAWDNAHLAHLGFIADLQGLVDGGAIYTIRSPDVVLLLEDTDERYRLFRGMLSGANVIGPEGIGGMIQRMMPEVSDLPPEARAMIKDLAGVDPQAVEVQDTVPIPAVSPLGLQDGETFGSAQGEVGLLFIPYDRAGGRLTLTLQNPDQKSDLQTVTLDGDFSLDLQAAQRDGVLLYDRCGPAGLGIDRVTPDDGDTFLYNRRPNVAVYFSRDYAAETLDTDRFRLTYPAPGQGSPVAVDVRLFRRGNMAWIKPVNDLMGGVRYTAWVKTGWDGVLDGGGNEISDDDGDGWYKWSFTTRPDFVPDENAAPGTSNLSCHVFQTVRDAPLIAGKPAVARIYADWRPHPEVNPDAQLREFDARVSLMNNGMEFASTDAHFVRPDLWQAYNVDEGAAEHTAQVFFTPTADMPASVRVKVEFPADPDESSGGSAYSACSTPKWPRTPKMTVQWFLVDVNQWRDLDIETDVRPWVEPLVGRAGELAKALFPVASVDLAYGGVLPWPTEWQRDRLLGDAPLNCGNTCAEGILDYWKDSPLLSTVAGISYDDAATIQIGILAGRPPDPAAGIEGIRGGSTPREIGQGGPARIVFAMEDDPSVQARMVEGIVHEIGHALWLEHLPYIANKFQQGEAASVRNDAWAAGDAIWYEGIEGFLIAPDGSRGWNKSSTEGNQESAHLVPLMYPGTIPLKDMFIARHQYLKIMDGIDDRGGLPGGG